MKYAIIAYPGFREENSSNFLTFLDNKSKFELGIGGRFRTIDFLFSMTRNVDARHIFLYQDRESDNLQHFLQNYVFPEELMRIHLLQKGLHQFIADTIKILKTSRVEAVIMYNADNPALFDISWMAQKFQEIRKNSVQFVLKNIGKANLSSKKTKFRVLFMEKEIFIDQLRTMESLEAKGLNFFERIMNESAIHGVPVLQANGYHGYINNIVDYYQFNLAILEQWETLNQIYSDFRLGSFLPQKGNSVIGEGGLVYNSVISEGCQIHGSVVDSIIFPGVYIHEDAEIVGSVILPYNHIGKSAKLYRTILDEAAPRSAKDNTFNIGEYCLVGKMDRDITGNNSLYPEILHDGLTVIGRNCAIPRKVKIGANCFISPQTDNVKIKMYNRVLDGAVL